MSAQPPSSDRPTGPPSGPLSGPTQQSPTPPPGTPPGPPTGGGGGPGGSGGGGGPAQGPGGEPERPWWRSVPRIATIGIALVAAVVLAIVLTRPGGGGSAAADEIIRDPVNSAGEAPYTPPSTDTEAPPKEPPAPPATNLNGDDSGVYGGTQQTASCNVEKQIGYLSKDPAKNSAFASVLGIGSGQVPGYLRSLTPLRLSYDTRVTNHGYKNGASTAYQSVLQAGTAVLVDDHGVPRVRCACGNPLQTPKKVEGGARVTGPTWSGFQQTRVVEVRPSVTVINVFVLFDPHRKDWFERKPGDHHGRHDKKVPPPPVTRPPTSPSPNTSSPSTGVSPQKPCPPPAEPSPGSSSPCPPTSPSSKSPSSESPSSNSPSSESPSSESPSSESPSSESPASGSSAPESPSTGSSAALKPDASSSSSTPVSPATSSASTS